MKITIEIPGEKSENGAQTAPNSGETKIDVGAATVSPVLSNGDASTIGQGGGGTNAGNPSSEVFTWMASQQNDQPASSDSGFIDIGGAPND